MLASPEVRATQLSDAALGKVFVDSTLVRNPRAYAQFLCNIHGSGMLRWSVGDGSHSVGIFFVKKKSGKLRIIFDTRLANCDFVSPLQFVFHLALPLLLSRRIPVAGPYFLLQGILTQLSIVLASLISCGITSRYHLSKRGG